MASGTIKKPAGTASSANILSLLTPSSGVSLRSANLQRNNGVVTISIQFDITTAKTNGQTIATGIPLVPQNFIYTVASYGEGVAPVSFSMLGELRAGGTGCPTGTWYSVSATYPI